MKQGKNSILAAAVSSALLLSGCSGDITSIADEIEKITDNETPGNSNDTPDNNQTYAGSSVIKGLVSLSSLARADYANITTKNIDSRSFARAADATSLNIPDDAIIKLYIVGPDGELLDTNIDCAFTGESDDNGNPGYRCDQVADGLHYIVKFIKLVDGNRAIEMQVNVEVPQGEINVDSPAISPQSTVVADTIVNAILSATAGKNISQEIVDSIIDSVKTAIVQLVESGAVQIPSMVTEAPKDKNGKYISSITELKSEKEIKFAENAQIDSTAGTLLSSKEVANGLDIVKVDIDLKQLASIDTETDNGKRLFVKRIFNELLENDDVPGFFIDFLSQQYISGKTVDIEKLFTSIAAGTKIDPAFGINLKDLGLKKSEAKTAFEAKLDEIHLLLDKKANGTLTNEDREKLAKIPPVIPAAFPRDTGKARGLPANDMLNIPQAIVFTIFITDDYIKDAFQKQKGSKLETVVSAEKDENGFITVEMDDPIDFDPMYYDPYYDPADTNNTARPGLMQLLGFFDDEYLNNLSGIDIFMLDIRPDKAWIPTENGMGQEYDMLRVEVGISDAAAMAKMVSTPQEDMLPTPDERPDITVTLEYPKSDGTTASVELIDMAELFNDYSDMPPPGDINGDMAVAKNEHPPAGVPGDMGRGPEWQKFFILDPWLIKQHSSNTPEMLPELTPDDIISDFTSGTYTVIVRDATGEELSRREFNKKVLTGMQYASPHLTSPNGMPQWPVECMFTTEPCTEFDQKMKEWQANGGATTFAPEEGETKAKVTISWEPPEVDLPDGVKIAYSLNVGFNQGCNEQGCNWELVYDSWQQGRLLFGTSFTLPTLLEQTSAGADYNVNICAQFIDTDSGDEIGQGGCGHANFFVGEPLDLSATFEIKGQAPTGLEGPWKVALITEKPDEDSLFGGWQTTVHQISDLDEEGRYLLQPRLGDFLNGEMIPPQIILFKDDADKVGEVEEREIRFWPNWEENIRFESWGGILRYVKEVPVKSDDEEPFDFKRKEVVITGGESLVGPSFLYLKDDPFFNGKQLSGEDMFGDKIIDIKPEETGYPNTDSGYPEPDMGEYPINEEYPELGMGEPPINEEYPELGMGEPPINEEYPEMGVGETPLNERL